MHQALDDGVVGRVHVIGKMLGAEPEAEVGVEALGRYDPVVPPAEGEVEVVRVELADALQAFERWLDFLEKVSIG